MRDLKRYGETYQKISEALEPYKTKCECGHVVVITNRNKKKICRWCGRMVYLYAEDKKRNDFKVEMRRLLNERSLY